MSGILVAQIPGIPGGPEVLIILLIIVLLFGTEKIPKLAGAIGEAQAEFVKSRQEIEKELQQDREGDGSSTTSTTDTSDTDTQSNHTDSQTGTGEQNSSNNEEANTRIERENSNELKPRDLSASTTSCMKSDTAAFGPNNPSTLRGALIWESPHSALCGRPETWRWADAVGM
jgi:sec-independent protein translocase protein TatA